MAGEKITRNQIARIWASAKQLGLSSEQLHGLVPGGSISHLTRWEGAAVIEELTRLGALPPPRKPSRKRRPAGPAWQATESQRALIEHLFRRLGWYDNPRRVEGFLRRYAGVEQLDQLSDRRRAIAVTEALKAILARQAAKSQAQPEPGGASLAAHEAGEGEQLGQNRQ